MLGAFGSEAAENHARNTASPCRYFSGDSADRDTRRKICRETINPGRDCRIGDRCQLIDGCEIERRSVTAGQQRLFVLVAAVPHWTNGVNDMSSLEPV